MHSIEKSCTLLENKQTVKNNKLNIADDWKVMTSTEGKIIRISSKVIGFI